MKHSKIILHGPSFNPTGLGYTRGYMASGLQTIGCDVECWNGEPVRTPDGRLHEPVDPTWGVPGYHLVIDQPMRFDPSQPWHGFMPFFELPPRPDERPRLLGLGGRRKIFCCNTDIQTWVRELNPTAPNHCTPLAQLGATVLDEWPTRQVGTVVTVGKAEPRKGTRILLRALQQLGYQGAYLAITSPLHQQVELEQLQTYADEGGHTLVPFTPSHLEVQRLLASCHVAVFPACAEGWNMGLTEALAQGCIVVASDIPAHRRQFELLVDGVGPEEAARRCLLVPTNDVPMTHHQRWYPPMAYPSVRWREPTIDAVAEAITQALAMPVPRPWEPDEFPLTWTQAARCLQQLISS